MRGQSTRLTPLPTWEPCQARLRFQQGRNGSQNMDIHSSDYCAETSALAVLYTFGPSTEVCLPNIHNLQITDRSQRTLREEPSLASPHVLQNYQAFTNKSINISVSLPSFYSLHSPYLPLSTPAAHYTKLYELPKTACQSVESPRTRVDANLAGGQELTSVFGFKPQV
jgi:hypothetical protein